MKSYFLFLKNRQFQGILAGTLIATLFVAVSVYGATTISTNISTGGTLTVTGVSTLTGNVTAAGTLAVTGVSTFTGRADLNGQASTTRFSVFDTLYVGGTSTTTITGNNTASTISYASTTAITATTASTTNLIVGGNSTNGTVTGLIFGECQIVERLLTATTTGGFACTGATGVSTSYKVFVTATSTLATTTGSQLGGGFVIAGASSTAANTIGVEMVNLTGFDRIPSGRLNFWAIK